MCSKSDAYLKFKEIFLLCIPLLKSVPILSHYYF